MAITRAQQAKQMLQDGGMLVQPGFGGTRQGYRGEAAAASDAAAGRSAGRDTSSAGTGNVGGDFDRDSFRDATRRGELKAEVERQRKEKLEEKLERFRQLNSRSRKFQNFARNFPIPSFISKFGPLNTRDFFTDKVLGSKNFANMTKEQFANLTEEDKEKAFDDYMSGRMSGETDAFGNPIGDTGGGGISPIIPVDTTFAQAPVEEEKDYYSGGSPFDINRVAYRLMADGGAVMDDEPRQAYGLGSIVKKATRAVKKVVKSDVGKAALTAAAIYYGGGGGMPKFLGGKGLGGFQLSNLFSLTKNPLISTDGKFSALKAIGIPTLASYFMTPKPEEEEEEDFRGEGLDIPLYRRNPEGFLAPRFRAEGGSINEKEKEPVAKKVMPLIDMDGKEKDYRETGGFVDMGRMEKADDVPARLSKNEFVFTADAVRNAGDGSVDKGAEVMYNMMKNLEAGGEVSKESQGLEGARKMFQTSQRLEEVL